MVQHRYNSLSIYCFLLVIVTFGIRQVDNQIWLVSFLEYELGYFDKERDRVEPGRSPFVPDKVLTMCPEYTFKHLVARGGIEPPTRGFSVRGLYNLP